MSDIDWTEAIRSVDWEALRSAEGSATPITRMLEDLKSIERRDRLRAISALYEWLCPDGFPYPAAVATVPFLVRLLEAETVLDKHLILILLHHLAAKEPNHTWRVSFPISAPIKPTIRATSDAVRAAGETYVSLLSDTDPRTRTAAAFLIAHLASPPPSWAEHLRSTIAHETDTRATASSILCLGHIGRKLATAEDLPLLQRLRGSHDGELARSAAAVALVVVGAALASDLLCDLERALLVAQETTEVLAASGTSGVFPWNGGSLAAHGADVLADHSASAPALVTRVLLNALRARLAAGQRLEAEPDATGTCVDGNAIF